MRNEKGKLVRFLKLFIRIYFYNFEEMDEKFLYERARERERENERKKFPYLNKSRSRKRISIKSGV